MLVSGIVTVLAGFLVGAYLLIFTDRNAASSLTFFGLAIIAGAAIPNIPRITHMGAETEKGKASIGFDMQQAVTDVKTGVGQVQIDKSEVTQIKNQVQTLVNQIKEADTRVAQSEQNVTQMQASIRQAYQALFDTLVVSLDTRNTFPPPQTAIDEMNRQLNILAAFAFPDRMEAVAEWRRLNSLAVRPPKPILATPIHTPANR